MKRKTQKECIPLTLLKYISQKYQGCWEIIEQTRKERGMEKSKIWTGKPVVWKDWCYIPMGTCLSIVERENRSLSSLNMEQFLISNRDAALMQVLAPWRQSKEIFSFDEELVKDLEEESKYTVNMTIPANIFLKLPYQGMYIETSERTGFFVCLENDPVRGDKELRFVFVDADTTNDNEPLIPGYISFEDNETIGEQVKKMYEPLNATDKMQAEIARQLASAFQLVLYLCSKQPDLRQTKKPVKRSAVVHDSYREVRQWDVGIRYGNAIRSYQKKIEEDSHNDDYAITKRKSHAPMRPHIRRGHFHHYWVGPRNKPAERKQELIWLEPTFVNAGDADKLPTTIHSVK